MRKSLLLYLFILSVLLNVFTYAYFSRKSAAESQPAADVSETKKLRDSIDAMHSLMAEANYFSLESDQNAQNYIVNNQLDKIIPYDHFSAEITEQLMDFNDKPEGNPYTGQEKISGKKFIINKAKVLNHRWIVADFTDGTYWGEALIKYFVNPDKTVSFETVETLIFQK